MELVHLYVDLLGYVVKKEFFTMYHRNSYSAMDFGIQQKCGFTRHEGSFWIEFPHFQSHVTLDLRISQYLGLPIHWRKSSLPISPKLQVMMHMVLAGVWQSSKGGIGFDSWCCVTMSVGVDAYRRAFIRMARRRWQVAAVRLFL
eukprot:12159577-Ditylum_brightwellii.AAC.1